MRALELNATNSAENSISTSTDPNRFSCQLIADAAHLRSARHSITCWAIDAGLDSERADDLALAVGEAVSNSIEHAYASDAGLVEIDGSVVGSELRVEIRDHGHWREPRSHPGWRGRGISMIHALADRAHVEQRSPGTTVSMWWRLRN